MTHRSGPRRVIVSIAEDRDPGEVVAALRAEGLVVDEVQSSLGTVTGAAEPGAVSALRRVPGVLDVEYARDVGIPDSEP
ncbi:hypothetical protein [Saccharomonospora saliphila]|uniref:hypothetical protein n=1 Tax=Saccharomonospora saliphila TaxID=369829 RepID=UPI00036A71C2|nr:hypothetical protein [Saccharomonospora saliphila]